MLIPHPTLAISTPNSITLLSLVLSLNPLSPVYAGQLLLVMGPALKSGQYTEARLLRRNDTDFTTDYQMQIAPQSRVELCAHLLTSCCKG